MTPAQLAELDSLRNAQDRFAAAQRTASQPEATPQWVDFAARDVREALGDYLLLRGGASLKAHTAHPVAYQLARGHSRRSLKEIAAHLNGLPVGAGYDQINMSLLGPVLGDGLADAMTYISGIEYAKQSREHSQLLKDLPTEGLKFSELVRVDIGTFEEIPRAGGPIQLAPNSVDVGARIEPAVYAFLILIGRHILINERAEILAQLPVQVVGHGARLEAQLTANILSSNAPLYDGLPLFGASNSVVPKGLNKLSLGEALYMLRTQTMTNGNVANLRGEFLVVPALREVDALELVATLGGRSPRLTVVPLAWLPAGYCYVMADPEESPVLVRSRPIGFPAEPTIERRPPVTVDADGNTQHFDGQAFKAEHIVGIQAVDRTGIVRIETP